VYMAEDPTCDYSHLSYFFPVMTPVCCRRRAG